MVVTMQDMTPLEELERLRAEFLGMVSHELRTPLAAIKGSADTLLEASEELDSAEMTQFHRIIRDQSENMRHLIGDLLDVARIETGSLPVAPEPVDATVLVDEARRRFQSGGGRSNLVIDLPPELPRVMADRRRIVQVLNNLLSNAARHSNELSAIRVAAVRDGVHVAFSVADDGVGVPAERLPHLFPQVLAARRRGAGTGHRGVGPGPCHLQGDRGGSRGPHPGRERRARPGKPVHLHRSCGGGGRHPPRSAVAPAQDEDQGAAPHSLRGRRPADAPVRAGRAHEGGLHARRDRRPGGGLLPAHGRGSAPPGPAGPDAAGQRRHGADEGDPAKSQTCRSSSSPSTVRTMSSPGHSTWERPTNVVKPFSPTELAARIRAALRKRAAPELTQPSEPYMRGVLTVDYARHRVTMAGRPVAFTAIEYRMLVELSANAGRALTHEHLLHRVWGPDKGEGSGPVRNIVKRLRRKLGDDPGNPEYILTEPSVGYRMEEGEGTEPQKA